MTVSEISLAYLAVFGVILAVFGVILGILGWRRTATPDLGVAPATELEAAAVAAPIVIWGTRQSRPPQPSRQQDRRMPPASTPPTELQMQTPSRHALVRRFIYHGRQKKGLRVRFAVYLIVSVWVLAVVVFGIVEHLVEPKTFPTVWEGMWWALVTVTTVGYGDVVPKGTAGKIIASFLLLGGLSLLAVITALVTSAFVTQAQAEGKIAADNRVMEKLDELATEFGSVKAEVARRRETEQHVDAPLTPPP